MAEEIEKTEEIEQLPSYILPSKAYTALKWTALVGIPALAIAYNGLANIWGLPYGEQISQTCSVTGLLIGSLIGVSAISGYKK